ncbi:uncharacterized protein ARMOST_17776 [Armillaria ostoyae]|uniref:Uncharacterized protein n=1 Tax=Armillaria ostoyae TaxID=47428 RepID=A0A284RZY4_ARMOS|nr:uncharacterized protein ARMOST_17776 [Armillaria ostoyae]
MARGLRNGWLTWAQRTEDVNVDEVVVDVALDDGGRRKGSCDRSFGSPSPSDCEHARIQSLEALLIWTHTQQKLFLQASFDFLARQFLDFAPSMVAPQPERHSDLEHFAGVERDGRADRAIGVLINVHRQLPCSTPPKLSTTNISLSNTTGFAVPLQYAAVVQCSQESSDEAYDDMGSEKEILRLLFVQQALQA